MHGEVDGRCSCLEMQWLRVEIFAGRVLRQRQCTMEGTPVCDCTGLCTLGGSVKCGGV